MFSIQDQYARRKAVRPTPVCDVRLKVAKIRMMLTVASTWSDGNWFQHPARKLTAYKAATFVVDNDL
jgi:hypothetical protein